MAYDEGLADRVRELLVAEPDVREQRMFGGLAFLIGGNMAVAVSGRGGLLVRVDPSTSETLVATTTARPMEMRGRPMRGWLYVDVESLRTRRQLVKWVSIGAGSARYLSSHPRHSPKKEHGDMA